MKNLHGIILLILLAVSRASGAPPEDTFNQQRLKTGQNLYREKRYLEAIPQLDVAAFGYLDRPASYSECLVWLSLAQNGAGRIADVDATLLHFLEVERRFPSYAQLNLPPEIRSDFHSLLLGRVPEQTILSIPSLATLVETREQKIAKLPPGQRKTALEAAARAEPASPRWPVALAREALADGDVKGAEKWANQALSLDASNVDAIETRARARELRGDYRGALADLGVLPAAGWEKNPELYGTQFVCLVETGDWKGATEASRKVPEALASRSDVVAAQRKLAAALQAQERAAAAAAPKPTARPPERAAAPARAVSPTAAPAAAARAVPTPAARRAPEPTPAAANAAVVAARSSTALAESRRLIVGGKSPQAEVLLSEALQSDPNNRDLRLALLEAACLARSYKTALAQIPLVEPFGDVEAPAMFYAAVVLYESGRAKEARSYFERAAPRVSGPLVDEYSKKIMGQD